MEEVPMSNLKIKDIETLETLSVEDLDKVVGGNMCPLRNNTVISNGKKGDGTQSNTVSSAGDLNSFGIDDLTLFIDANGNDTIPGAGPIDPGAGQIDTGVGEDVILGF